MSYSKKSVGNEPTAQRFIDHFEVNSNQSAVSLNPKLCCTMAVFEKLIKDGRLHYRDLGINKEYYRNFKKQVLYGLKISVNELIRLASIAEIGDNTTDHQMDYNTLDYLEGLIKSAVENNLIRWKKLGFENIDNFNDALESIRELIDQSTEQDFLETDFNDDDLSGLSGYEGDGKITGDYNLFPDDQMVRESDLRKRIFLLTDKRAGNDEQEILDDLDYEILKKYASASIVYLSVRIPKLKY